MSEDIIIEIVEKLASDDKIAVSPSGWPGTIRAMKKHKDITNPYALSWWMSKQKPGTKWGPGGKLTKKPESHYKPEKKKSEEIDKIDDDKIIIKLLQEKC